MKIIWAKPSFGLWFGTGAGNADDEGSAQGGLVLGEWLIQFGLLLGGVIGIGEDYGIYTGLMGAVALLPLLGAGFIGVPIGFHWKKRFGLGLIIPLPVQSLIGITVTWWIAALAGIAIFALFYEFGGEMF